MSEVETAITETSTISESVVEAVAEAKGVDPLELTPPLYSVIDPDALDRIFAASPTDGRMDGEITFSYNGYEVTVRGAGSISVEEREA